MNRPNTQAFTVVEMLIATSIFAFVTVAMLAFSSTSLRMISRNLATNHSHESMRSSGQLMLRDLHASASAFRLIDFNGTNYSDSTVSVTTDKDSQTEMLASSRANGVRFRLLIGGPYRLQTGTTSSTTELTIDFARPAPLSFVEPMAGDKIVLPLISREYDIASVQTQSGTVRKVTISDASGIGFTLDTNNNKTTTVYLYRQVAYTVYKGELRYHRNYTGSLRNKYDIVRSNVTSPKPFSLLYEAGSTSTDGLGLRVSLEFNDTAYGARQFRNSPVTLQAVIPPRTQPTPVSTTNAT